MGRFFYPPDRGRITGHKVTPSPSRGCGPIVLPGHGGYISGVRVSLRREKRGISRGGKTEVEGFYSYSYYQSAFNRWRRIGMLY